MVGGNVQWVVITTVVMATVRVHEEADVSEIAITPRGDRERERAPSIGSSAFADIHADVHVIRHGTARGGRVTMG